MDSQRDDTIPYLRAMLLVLLAGLPEGESSRRAELLLQRAGLGIKEISDLLGKSYAATAKAISRGRAR